MIHNIYFKYIYDIHLDLDHAWAIKSIKDDLLLTSAIKRLFRSKKARLCVYS